MISSQKALDIILDTTTDYGTEEVSFLEAQGRVLKEEIYADRDFPPFNRVSMDGIAINYDAFLKGKRSFPLEAIQAAGSKVLTLNNTSNCIEVMTGAILPMNTDTVIRYEDITIKDGRATLNIEDFEKGQNVHRKGRDRSAKDVLIRKNTKLSAAELGILATVGKSKVKVAKHPRVIIISTGDELVEVDSVPDDHQIRRSNVYTLLSLLKRLGINADNDHITDDKSVLKATIERHLERYDVLIFSGAVSKGKFDFLPEVLDELGVIKLFHRVKQRPGKPFWFGVKSKLSSGEKEGSISSKKVIFAFPGNPVSTFVGCLKYFYPWYKKSVEIPYNHQGKAILKEDFVFKPELTYFLQVKLDEDGGLKIAKPIVGNGSGDLANLADIDGFLELPEDRAAFKAGETFPLITFR